MSESTERRQLPVWQESILLIITALVMATVIKAFFVQAFYIPSGSMVPTFQTNDKVLVQKWSYWRGEPQRGDVIVFDDPGDWLPGSDQSTASNPIQRGLEVIGLYPTGGHLIKRVIGVGGDRVACCDEEGRTTVNGEPIDEPYLNVPEANRDITFDTEVPAGHVWVQGDNRGDSEDSRRHMGEPGGGFVPVEDVVGKAWLRVWPLDRIGFIDSTEAFGNVPNPGS